MLSKFILSSIIFLSYFWITTARSYPIKQIRLNHCFPTDTVTCTVDLPIIQGANYTKYQDDSIYRRVYSVLRSATYTHGRDFGKGSHKGLDIATAEGTPVYASADGIVIHAGWQEGRGRFVTIEHIHNQEKLWTTYAHLSQVLTNTWDKVREGQLIGEVGDTGNSYGSHLHFQLDKNQDNRHPRHFINCAGQNNDIVNEGRCQDQMYANTLDPILFIESQTTVSQNSFVSKEKMESKKANITISWFNGGYIPINFTQTLILQNKSIQEIGNQQLSDPITIEYDSKKLHIIPSTIRSIQDSRKVFIIGLQPSINIVIIKQGDTVLHKIPVIIGNEPTFARNNNKIISTMHHYLF